MKMIDKEKTSRFECKLFGNDHAEKNYQTYKSATQQQLNYVLTVGFNKIKKL